MEKNEGRMALSKITAHDFSARLFDFWNQGHRVLPWRSDPSPFHVWVSEIMLQQTRVDTVKGYYLRFVDTLPNVKALADAPEDVYLKLWEGLGYYSRVRNLHRAALEIQNRFHGEIPSSYEELVSLPGIGDYTANAILACAFHLKAVAVDGNLIRVYARLFASSIDPGKPADRKKVQKGFLQWLEGDPATFNQALMEIGQTICIPNGKPLCSNCPFASFCSAHLKKSEDRYPNLNKRPVQKAVKKTVFVVRCKDKTLLRKRADKGLLASLYELPNVDGELTLDEARKEWCKKGYCVESIVDLGHAKHVFSHQIWAMTGYAVSVSSPLPNDLFIDEGQRKSLYPIPTAFSYFLP